MKYILSEDVQLIQEAQFEHKIQLGLGKQYGIWREGIPYMLFEVEVTHHPFDTVCVFGDYVYIGSNDELIIINMDLPDYRIVECDFYFGYFYEYEELLLVATGTRLMCFQKDSQLKWQTEPLAIDGVTFIAVNDDGTISVNCCMDPYPAVWCKKVIALEDGKLCQKMG